MSTLAFWLLYPILWCLSMLPFPILYFLSDVCYLLVYRVFGYRTKTVRYNVRTAFPEMDEKALKNIEKKFYHHLCDIFIEMVKSMTISKKSLLKRYTFENPEVILQYDKADQSSVLMMGHYASYEWAFALQLYIKHPGYAVYKKLSNKQFDDLAKKIRGRWNTFLLDSKTSLRAIKKIEDEGKTGCYGFAADQSPRMRRATFWTSFLGHELPFFTGAERTAKEFNLPVIFLAVDKVKRGHYHGTFHLLAEAPREFQDYEITSAFAKALEKQIRERPELYLWTHKRFKLLGKKKEALTLNYSSKKS